MNTFVDLRLNNILKSTKASLIRLLTFPKSVQKDFLSSFPRQCIDGTFRLGIDGKNLRRLLF